ncbi:MAG: DapH/DapD/GlmU-related protein [Sulfobacillus sp.]
MHLTDPPPEYITIGYGTYWTNPVHVEAFIDSERIVVGKYCSIAKGVTLMVGGNHTTETVATWPFDNLMLKRYNPTRSYRTTKPTVIGHDVWLGLNSTICGGVEVGNGAVVGVGAVVFEDVPPYAVAIGNPAQVVRYRFSQTTVQALQRIAWWDWPVETLRERVEWFYRPVAEFIKQFGSESLVAEVPEPGT